MAIVFLQADGVPITAQAERQGSAALYGGGSGRQLGGRSGFRVGTPADTLTATATAWTLKPCAAQIDPGASTNQGMYGWASTANETGTVTASDATYARKDIVYIQVNDSTAGDGSGSVSATPAYLAGTPSATPTAPTLPPRSFLVGTIDVPKTGAGSPTATLNPARFVAAGAPQPATLAERDALAAYDGLSVRRMDVAGRPVETFDGGAWRSPTIAPTFYAFLDPQTNFGFSGTCAVTSLSDGKKRVEVDLTVARDGGGSFGLTGAAVPQSLGVVLPAAARGTSNTKAVATYLNGGGSGPIPLQVNVVPSTGEIEVRSQGAQSWVQGATATVNLTYYV